MGVGRPRVVMKEIDGEKQEPYELLTVDVEDGHQGAVMEELGRRKGDMQDMVSDGRGRVRPGIPHSGARTDRFSGPVPDAGRAAPASPATYSTITVRSRATWTSAATAC